MGRTRSPEVQRRNEVIYAEWLRGASLTSLGERHGLARQVVGRIVAAQHPEGAEDEDRALFRGYMWRLYDEVQDIGDRPGYKMTPRGGIAEDEDGNPALDTNVQVQAKELQLKILRELRLLDARDKPVVQRHSHEFYENQAAADIARRLAERDRQIAEDEKRRRELEEMERRLAVVPGEVIREIGSAQP